MGSGDQDPAIAFEALTYVRRYRALFKLDYVCSVFQAAPTVPDERKVQDEDVLAFWDLQRKSTK